MGIISSLFGKKKIPAFSSAVYSVSVNIHPIRLAARKADFAQMDITVTNNFEKELLTSVVIDVPKALGFEQSALSHQKEVRLGNLGPGETRNIRISVWGTARTEPAAYAIGIYVMSHYRDYSYILNEVKKTVELRVA